MGMHDASSTVMMSAKLPTPLIAFATDPSVRCARGRAITSGPISQRCVSWRRQNQHFPHTGVIETITRWPGRTRDTSSPTHSTTPHASCPRIIGLPPGMRSITAWSEWHTPLACTWTIASRGPGVRAVTSSSERSCCCSTKMAARMRATVPRYLLDDHPSLAVMRRSSGQDHLGERVAVELGSVLATHHAQLVVGDVTPQLLDHELGVGPRAVAVGIVGLHHDVLHADAVARDDGRRIVDGAEPEIALHHVGRALVPSESVPRAVDDGVEAVEQHGDPADAAFAHRELEGRMLHRVLGPEPLRARGEGQLTEE